MERTQYRITFHDTARWRLDPFELAWLLSKHECEVVAKNEVPMLFVLASPEDLVAFLEDVNREYGRPLIFKAIEEASDGEYVEAALNACPAE